MKTLLSALTVWLLLITGTSLAAQAPAPIPRPEHPVPGSQRAEWLNLNGSWEFAETDDDADTSFIQAPSLPDRIVVPFARESSLSGLARRGFVRNVWYRRAFTVPAGWKSPRVRLHVGACDYRTTVRVNEQVVGTHVGGSAPFVFDVTSALRSGENTVVIHAFDDTRSGLQPCGKQAQSPESEGCVYTRTTGIWQTVWLEGVGSSFIDDASIVPDPAASRIHIQAEIAGPSAGLEVVAEASLAGKSVGSARVPAAWRNSRLVVDLSEKRLWSLETPTLYDLELSLVCGGEVVDRLKSYFGLRVVTIEGRAILINGKPVFQRTVLDQGFYPDGIWTAPTDEALRRDVELSKAAGFNGARLHQKVFEPRLLYWADRLGYLLWGEFPNWGLQYENPKIDLPVINEWVEILRRDRNHPSIVGWCPFNETPPSAGPLQATIVSVTRAIDPTRPIIESSGYAHTVANPDVLDAHDYDGNPATFRSRWMSAFGGLAGLPARYGARAPTMKVPFFVSEYGGIGWFEAKGETAWGYGNMPRTEEEFFARYKGLTDAQLDNRDLFGFCYTQLTDIEQERNGVYYYDRRPKFAPEKFRAITARTAAYETDPPIGAKAQSSSWRVLVGAGVDAEARDWKYSLEQPAVDWAAPGFDDSAWRSGKGGFGTKPEAQPFIRTPWSTPDIWLRQGFEVDGSGFAKALLVTHFDNDTEVYLNGDVIWKGERWNDAYAGFDVTEAVRKSLRKGRNVIAIHCRQEGGGQFIDAALLLGS